MSKKYMVSVQVRLKLAMGNVGSEAFSQLFES